MASERKSVLADNGNPARILRKLLWAEEQKAGNAYHRIDAATRRLLELGYVERDPHWSMKQYVRLTAAGREEARRLAASPAGVGHAGELTAQEVNAQVAQNIMGWSNVYFSERGEMYAATPESAPQRSYCPLFTESLDACAAAERRMAEIGLDSSYVAALQGEINRLPESRLLGPFALVTAPPATRCRAMLRTIARATAPIPDDDK